MISTDKSYLLADSPPTICKLEIAPHFEALTSEEKLYAHHISRASFLGTRIVLRQVSPESEGIYDLILATYRAIDGNWSKLAEETGESEENVKLWLEYAAAVLGNLGNYKSFGDQKFVPRIPRESLQKLSGVNGEAMGLFEKVVDRVYSTEPASSLLLGYPQDGHVSTYYPDSPDITKNDIERAHNVVSGAYYAENTRLQKVCDKEFRLLVASSSTSTPEKSEFDMGNGQTLKILLGDHSKEMTGITEECLAAAHTGLNENEKSMFSEYAKSFATGSINSHKDAQRFWIKDKGPRVECNLGFVETYRDPHGIRGEWEGFVAMVNQGQTRKFGQMVARAGEFIPRLPWSTEFEKDEFLKPDFTSLEVLSFCTSGIPAGINIPNYDDLRQTFGFKNVSLGNVLSAKAPNEPITFIREADKTLYKDHKESAFEVQVGIHELLGHGTGKLLQETEKGKYNFDINKPPMSPITGEPVDTWYKSGETWGSVFGSIAASYEECRAECVAMYLGGELDLLEIFGYGKDTEKRAEDVLYIEYLQMARAGLLALEYWDPEYKKWGQGHMQARFSILKTMLASGVVELVSNKADHDDLVISLDRSKIRSHGIPAVGDYLQKLHVYKSAADFEGGRKLYEDMTTVGEDMARYREVVMRKKLPRKQFVQANTVLEGGVVTLKEYEPTPEGLVRSYVERGV